MKKLFILIIILIFLILNYFNLFPKRTYNNEYFNIEDYVSKIDKDQDGIDDQTDILKNAKKYVNSKPKYKSKYYESGYPNDEYGVCTDVIAYALKNSGYDLMELINQDMIQNKNDYHTETIDKNIDFRRVKNIKIYLDKYTIPLTVNLNKINEWQAGDIVVFENHIAIVSDKRTKKGIPYISHHSKRPLYEEDAISLYKIVGHYRIS